MLYCETMPILNDADTKVTVTVIHFVREVPIMLLQHNTLTKENAQF
jgi:hypothetical protein